MQVDPTTVFAENVYHVDVTDQFKNICHVKYVHLYTHISSTLVKYKVYSPTDTSKYTINK